MRLTLQKLTKYSPRFLVISVSLLLTALIPGAVMAWGPNRTTFTQAKPATYVTFNSITDNPKWGDERNFMRIRELSADTKFGDSAKLQAGRQYEVIILFHNNAASPLNASGQGVAVNAFARTEIPAIVESGKSGIKAMSYVGASNAKPTSVYDHIDLANNTNADIALRYVKNSARIASNGKINGLPISESLFSGTGTKLGYDSLDGALPGCDQYSGYITFTLVADSPGFTFQKDVRLAGTKVWADSITANKGDKLEYRLSYKNTGTTTQNNVMMKDILPAGLTYVRNSTDVANSLTPNGERVNDGINGGGINIGSYAGGANAFLYFNATVEAEPCAILTNTASVETANGNRQDIATVKVGGTCALPTTGPVEVISGFVGLAAITIGIVYYFKSRQELDDALLHAQSHPLSIDDEHKK